MKYSLSFKFIAVLVCTATLLTILACSASLVLLGATDLLGERTVEDYWKDKTELSSSWLANDLAGCWASQQYGDMPEELAAALVRRVKENSGGTLYYTLRDEKGKEILSDYHGEEVELTHTFQIKTIHYDRFLSWESEYWLDETQKDSPERERAFTTGFYSEEDDRYYQYTACNDTAPGCEVTLYLTRDGDDMTLELLSLLVQRKKMLPVALIGSLLVFAIGAVYLCSAAAHRPGSGELRPSGLNRLPLDLYAFAVLGGIAVCLIVVDEYKRNLDRLGLQVVLLCAAGMGFACCLLFVGFCFAFAAQVKVPRFFWLRNSACGWCVRMGIWAIKKCGSLLRWLAPRILWLIRFCVVQAKRLLRDVWKVAMLLAAFAWDTGLRILRQVGRMLIWCGKQVERFLGMLPLMWQWLVVGGVLLQILYVTGRSRNFLTRIGGIAFCIGVVVYSAVSFGNLLDALKKLRSGDLEAKVDDRFLIGSFRESAQELNGLADVSMVAAQKQLKSERMKTELITNVSHDIKTPLTSIINYVDLLGKPHTPEQEKMYLEVLSRQSQRMKKLIEDLMEMSKASTGNIPVEIAQIDAVEAVNQALGEFTDKLAAAGLTPIFYQPEENVILLADGRLLWRAMSNILSNAVKYALPGTRLYVDVSTLDDKAVISFKNISGAQLNISADELMERFVRGDSSRNTEGSGLGLNIAKSLMELQKGQLQLLVDGDLFKVTLVFLRAQ